MRFEFSDPGESFPVIPAGSRIVSISILYDEGTDVVLPTNPGGIGLAVIDNIFIDGRTITRGSSDDRGDRDRDDEDDDDDDDEDDD